MASNTVAQRVARDVRAEMARREVSQEQLAKAVGVSQAQISRRLTGRVPFDVEELAAVAEFLQIPLASLLQDAA